MLVLRPRRDLTIKRLSHERGDQFLAGLGHAVLLGDQSLDVGEAFGKDTLQS